MTKLNNAFRFRSCIITANNINGVNYSNGTKGIFMQKNKKYINNSPASRNIEP